MTVDPIDYAARALSVRDTGRYRLGAGPRDPNAPTPLNEHGECDCSAYVFWLWRRLKRLPAGITAAGYSEVNTNAMVADAQGKQRVVALVPVGAEVKVGDAVVYGGLTVAGVRLKIGHTGGIVGVPAGWSYKDTASLGALRISHCNGGPAPAIDESNGRLWAKRGIVVRRVG